MNAYTRFCLQQKKLQKYIQYAMCIVNIGTSVVHVLCFDKNTFPESYLPTHLQTKHTKKMIYKCAGYTV